MRDITGLRHLSVGALLAARQRHRRYRRLCLRHAATTPSESPIRQLPAPGEALLTPRSLLMPTCYCHVTLAGFIRRSRQPWGRCDATRRQTMRQPRLTSRPHCQHIFICRGAPLLMGMISPPSHQSRQGTGQCAAEVPPLFAENHARSRASAATALQHASGCEDVDMRVDEEGQANSIRCKAARSCWFRRQAARCRG